VHKKNEDGIHEIIRAGVYVRRMKEAPMRGGNERGGDANRPAKAERLHWIGTQEVYHHHRKGTNLCKKGSDGAAKKRKKDRPKTFHNGRERGKNRKNKQTRR